ncbi:MAG: hypothetical protein GXO97_01450 [Nitrospirae bacterium]|nr:hypothetical protein [Nitrospirota bacterium]
MSIISEASWLTIVEKLLSPGTTALLLGASDSGKTTLSWFLTESLLKAGKDVCLLDADIGQSTIGPPATVSLKFYHNQDDLKSSSPDYMSFVGVFNPSKRIPQILRSIKVLFDIARKRASMQVIVDTTGLISGEIGFHLKTGKIKLIRPDYVIALQRDRELEHILSAIDEHRIIRVPVSPHVKERTRQYRINYRNRRFKEYFQGLHIHCLSLNEISLIYKDRIYKPSEIFIKENTVLGLNREEDITPGLGLFERIDSGRIFITTPLETLKGINRIIVGEIQYIED